MTLTPTSLTPTSLSPRAARRLALCRAGLLKPEWTALPSRVPRGERRARAAAHAVVDRFGYLQLDTVSIAGARSHAIVLLSRLEGFSPELGESLLQPGEPLFEYWGHEACWLPLALYPTMAFRREEFRVHPWWGDLIGEHPRVVEELLRRIRDEGPLRSQDLEGEGGKGWWQLKFAKKVVSALWSRGDLAIRERRGFQRTFDLAERVIPHEVLARATPREQALKELLLLALAGHGWAQTGTLTATWRLRNRAEEIRRALNELVEAGAIVPAELVVSKSKRRAGWVRPEDLELAARLEALRPRRDCGVLLSPFDPVLWDRTRVADLFGFDQVLEIFKPEPRRVYGYYCLPVLAGDRLVARFDLKADRKAGRLKVLSLRYEEPRAYTADAAARAALERYAAALGLAITGG